jgi:hypothetical protein
MVTPLAQKRHKRGVKSARRRDYNSRMNSTAVAPVFDDLPAWEAAYRAWLAAAPLDFTTYPRPRNTTTVAGRGIELAASRLLLISSAGAYLAPAQTPFAAADPLGDYTLRTFSAATPAADLAFAHDHYDHAAVRADPEVLLPLAHLRARAAAGQIGSLAPVVSFMGYQPDVRRLLAETVPAVLAVARADCVQAALLVPS